MNTIEAELTVEAIELHRPPKEVSQPVNIVAEREGDILTIMVDLSKSFGLTKGQNVLVASTKGSIVVGNVRGKRCWLGLNVYLK
jgi:hypothetical protein